MFARDEIANQIIEEDISTLGQVYDVSDEQVCVKLLNGELFHMNISKKESVHFKVFDWVDVFGRAKRNPVSMTFEAFDIKTITPNPRGYDIAKDYLESKDNHLKYEVTDRMVAEKVSKTLHSTTEPVPLFQRFQ